jgi:hypothetical protein
MSRLGVDMRKGLTAVHGRRRTSRALNSINTAQGSHYHAEEKAASYTATVAEARAGVKPRRSRGIRDRPGRPRQGRATVRTLPQPEHDTPDRTSRPQLEAPPSRSRNSTARDVYSVPPGGASWCWA